MSTHVETLTTAERKQQWAVGILVFITSVVISLSAKFIPQEAGYLSRGLHLFGPWMIMLASVLYVRYGKLPSFLTHKTQKSLRGEEVSVFVPAVMYGGYIAIAVIGLWDMVGDLIG